MQCYYYVQITSFHNTSKIRMKKLDKNAPNSLRSTSHSSKTELCNVSFPKRQNNSDIILRSSFFNLIRRRITAKDRWREVWLHALSTELPQNSRSEVGVPVLAKFYDINTEDYVENVSFTCWKFKVLQVAIVGHFVLDYQAS